MSTPIEIANDIKAAILELAAGHKYPDLLEAVDSLLIRSSNKGYAQGLIDGKAIAAPTAAQGLSDALAWIEEAVEYVNSGISSPSLEREGRAILSANRAAQETKA